MARIEKTVFLSYRRTNAPWALSIYQNLTANGFDVFFDYKGISSGDFESAILENIRARAHFLVALTPSALERCADPGDWLRREIEEAIECRRNIVPMLLEGFDFGASAVASQLTGRLAELKKYNGLTLPIEYFDAAMERLREKFLNVPVNTVLHRASVFAREAAKEQQTAAGLLSIEAEKRKQEEEEERLKAEERQRLEEEQKQAEAERKVDEDRKRKEIEAIGKAAEEHERRQTEKETGRANKDRNEIKAINKKKSATKIGVLIALVVVIVAGAMFLFWQELTKREDPQKSPQAKVNKQEKKPTSSTANLHIIEPMPSPAKSQAPTQPPPEIAGKVQGSSESLDLPQPKIILLADREEYPAGGRQWISYKLAVTNWASYPVDLFEPASDLPPCGSNKNSSRTWVAIYDAIKKEMIRRNCGYSSPQDLNGLMFPVEKGYYPPKAVYVEFEDRRKGKKYISNTVEVK